jgi:hypothetical protein
MNKVVMAAFALTCLAPPARAQNHSTDDLAKRTSCGQMPLSGACPRGRPRY